MRSPVGLVILLSLHSFCVLAVENLPVVACGRSHDKFMGYGWTKWASQKKFIVPNCDFTTVSKLCRASFPNVSHGVPLNATQNALVDPKSRRIAADLYWCQTYSRPKEPTAPEGSWSDRLHLDAWHECVTEAVLVSVATNECGKTPVHHVPMGKCGDEDKYVEMFYICDKPRNDSLPVVIYKKTYQFDRGQFDMLENFAKTAEYFQKVRREACKIDLFSAAKAAIEGDIEYSQVFLNQTFRSRKSHFINAKEAIRRVAIQRSQELFVLAAQLFTNGSCSEQKPNISTFDVENVFQSAPWMEEIVKHFPEVKQQLIDYYVDYCRNHTLGITSEYLGFLNETGSSERIISIYINVKKAHGSDTGHGGYFTSMAHTLTKTDAFSDSDTVHLHGTVIQMQES
ncbi:hypothetical protein QR680_003889 [Steinernema hermaphroditum]|uniref:Uncharacterized protein n=1 Tax=Steinernema hermaphroditum TaxID=289476 RepID=A0AA39HLY4_9BILA|nr:hypothetical protein QR680_003889 [Steinernema hermaphroditum]